MYDVYSKNSFSYWGPPKPFEKPSSEYDPVIVGVPQDSIPGSLLYVSLSIIVYYREEIKKECMASHL